MHQKLLNGSAVSEFTVGIIRQVVFEWIVEMDAPVFYELHRGDGGEHLVHRSDAEAGIDAVRNVTFAIGKTVSPLEKNPATVGDQDDAGESVIAGARGEVLSYLREKGTSVEPPLRTITYFVCTSSSSRILRTTGSHASNAFSV
jgi:hypothetical protein